MNLDDASLTLTTDDLVSHSERIGEVLRRWRDETHPGPWLHCDEQPCHAIQRL